MKTIMTVGKIPKVLQIKFFLTSADLFKKVTAENMDIQIPCAYPLMMIKDAKPAAPVNYGCCYIDFSCRLKVSLLNFYSFVFYNTTPSVA
jgi:hypothetical protein